MVTVAYTSRLDNGEVFDGSDASGNLRFVAGGSSVLPGLSRGVLGLPLNELRELKLLPADAYGERDEARVLEVPARDLPPGAREGTEIKLGTEAGKGGAPAVVRSVGTVDTPAVLDLNHPLAGLTVHVEVQVLAKEEPHVVQPGDLVYVQYAAFLEEDLSTALDASAPNHPLEFIAGAEESRVLRGLAQGIIGLTVGRRTELVVAPEDGYGFRDEEKVVKLPQNQFPAEGVKTGTTLTVQVGEEQLPAVITEVDDESVTLDMNVPLAGKTLLFSVEVTKVARKERVKDLGNGLILETTADGDCSTFPKQGGSAKIHYVGTLDDNGEVFVSTPDLGAPLEVALGKGQGALLRGIDQALPHMSLGERAVLRVPSEPWGFGERGSPDGKVPPGAAFRLFVELLEVK